jgi:hypothetical protein
LGFVGGGGILYQSLSICTSLIIPIELSYMIMDNDVTPLTIWYAMKLVICIFHCVGILSLSYFRSISWRLFLLLRLFYLINAYFAHVMRCLITLSVGRWVGCVMRTNNIPLHGNFICIFLHKEVWCMYMYVV